MKVIIRTIIIIFGEGGCQEYFMLQSLTLRSSMQNCKLNVMLLFRYRVTSFKYGNTRFVEVEVCTEGRWPL